MTTIEIFKKMLDWLYANTEASNQTDVARKAGMNQVTMSRILNGKVKNVKPETMRAVNAAFGNVFNPEWMRGESDVMLVADLQPAATAQAPVPAGSPGGEPSTTLDAMTAAILAAKDETIASKEEIIAAMRSQLADKDDVIAAKDALISTLQQQLDTLRTQLAIEKGLSEDGTSLSDIAKRYDHFIAKQ